MIMTEENKTVTFDEVWENFVKQLNDARIALKEKEEEIEADAAHMTRIDLTEFNTLKIAVTKLEAAVETMDILRTEVFKQPSLIITE
jgi:hypothetical protein